MIPKFLYSKEFNALDLSRQFLITDKGLCNAKISSCCFDVCNIVQYVLGDLCFSQNVSVYEQKVVNSEIVYSYSNGYLQIWKYSQ